MIIEVTQRDIDNALPMDRCFCPIALALKRQTKLENFAVDSLNYKDAYIEIEGTFLPKIYLPKSCAEFMKEFDFDKHVKPFKFELDYVYNDG